MKLTKSKLKEIIREEIQKLNEARKYKLGDSWSKDFDYEGMLKMGVNVATAFATTFSINFSP